MCHADQQAAIVGQTPDSANATLMLQRVAEGDPEAAAKLLPMVYEQLRALAGSHFRGRPAGQTLQPTALVHEAYLKMVNQTGASWKDRAHFFAVAATAMRQILHDRARRKRAVKRGGGAGHRVTLDGMPTPSGQSIIDLIALDDALTRLTELDARQARIVELKFFGGMTNEDVAQVLDLSTRMIEKEWRKTRAWLSAQLDSGESA